MPKEEAIRALDLFDAERIERLYIQLSRIKNKSNKFVHTSLVIQALTEFQKDIDDTVFKLVKKKVEK